MCICSYNILRQHLSHWCLGVCHYFDSSEHLWCQCYLFNVNTFYYSIVNQRSAHLLFTLKCTGTKCVRPQEQLKHHKSVVQFTSVSVTLLLATCSSVWKCPSGSEGSPPLQTDIVVWIGGLVETSRCN